MCAHVLVAEDDPRQAEVLRRYLEADGHSTVVVHDGRSALEHARRQPPDLLVLDVMMPQLDGLNVCRTLRQESDLLVLMLTARTEEDDLLLGLQLGADDYVTKPYSPRELMARIRTLLRRSRRDPSRSRAGGCRHGRARGTDAEDDGAAQQVAPVERATAVVVVVAVVGGAGDVFVHGCLHGSVALVRAEFLRSIGHRTSARHITSGPYPARDASRSPTCQTRQTCQTPRTPE